MTNIDSIVFGLLLVCFAIDPIEVLKMLLGMAAFYAIAVLVPWKDNPLLAHTAFITLVIIFAAIYIANVIRDRE